VCGTAEEPTSSTTNEGFGTASTCFKVELHLIASPFIRAFQASLNELSKIPPSLASAGKPTTLCWNEYRAQSIEIHVECYCNMFNIPNFTQTVNFLNICASGNLLSYSIDHTACICDQNGDMDGSGMRYSSRKNAH
jgi:hypothetical protein